MPKEALIAIIIGFMLGLLITFGIYTANRSLKENKIPNASPTSTAETDNPASSSKSKLIIESPENESLVEDETVTIKGEASPEAIIAVFTETNEHLFTANKEGLFSIKITLIKGVNNIKITAVDKDNNKAQENLTLVYSTAKLD